MLWALPLVGVLSRQPDASLHAPHGRGLRASGTVALLTEEQQLHAAIALLAEEQRLHAAITLLAEEQQLHDRDESDNSTLRVLNETDRHDRKFPVAWSLGALGAFAAPHKHEEPPPAIVLVYNDSNATHADNSSLPGLNETEAPRRFFSPFSWQLGAMSAHPSAQAQQDAQNSSQLQQEQMNMTTEDRPRMMLSWRLGGMAAMVPDAVNTTDNATATDDDDDDDALNVTDTDSSRAKIGFGWGLGAMSVANAMERQQEQEQVLLSVSPSTPSSASAHTFAPSPALSHSGPRPRALALAPPRPHTHALASPSLSPSSKPQLQPSPPPLAGAARARGCAERFYHRWRWPARRGPSERHRPKRHAVRVGPVRQTRRHQRH